MATLKEIYDIRKDIITNSSVDDFKDVLDSTGVDSTINMDNTIRVESDDGLDKIVDSINTAVPEWYGSNVSFSVSLLYNLLPLSNNMCILRF